MTVIERKRSADVVAGSSSTPANMAPVLHRAPPCFWAVLDGESLNFVYLSASLHTFLGSDRTTALFSQSLFDYIHPEEAHHARRDLASTFATKSFVGSSIRCRLRRLDHDKAGFQQIFRRASESQILLRGRSAQNLHESAERKLSLPTIPDIIKLRANGGQALSPTAPSGLHQPMPKRLRTILEDSVGSFVPTRDGGVGQVADSSSSSGPGGLDDENDDNAYMIANIGLYLVSARLLIMVCHYEDPPPEGRLPATVATAAKQPRPDKAEALSQAAPAPTDQCSCAAGTPTMADAERVQLLMSQIHKVDAIGGGGSAPNKDSNGGGGRGGGSSSLSSRHVQIYSASTEQLLCAFPEDAYRRIHGQSPSDAAKGGAELRGLWQHCHDKQTKAHAASLLQGPCIPNTNPIRLELQVRTGDTDALTDVQSLFFRWGHLLFVCQQMRGDNTPELGAISVDDNLLASYNLSTPPSDDPARGGSAHTQKPGSIVGPVGDSGRGAVRNNPSPLNPAAASEARPFSLPRAPASVVANLPPRTLPTPAQNPTEPVPPRRQSSHTLPPAKTFEERRFSYPIQTLYTERRPPPLPIPQAHQQQYQYQQQQQQLLPPPVSQFTGVTPASATPGSGASHGSPVTASPGSRLMEVRQRIIASARSSGSLLGKGAEGTQPTPTISPMSAGIVQHTPVSLSPAPQPHSASAGYVHVNMYPPDTGMWRWTHVQQPLSAQTLPPTPNSCGPGHPQLAYAQRPPPPLALGRAVHSPHPHFVHGVHDQYHSPLGSAVASPSMVGPPSAHRDSEKKTCKSCGTDSSPEWRKGPTGHKT
ncbi:hypothetical protein IWW55_002111 [Coemansia sp. RSA 2706]|nr:hypothetical protein IWW55_002111 [Coemansia sp. RSA 2706]